MYDPADLIEMRSDDKLFVDCVVLLLPSRYRLLLEVGLIKDILQTSTHYLQNTNLTHTLPSWTLYIYQEPQSLSLSPEACLVKCQNSPTKHILT